VEGVSVRITWGVLNCAVVVVIFSVRISYGIIFVINLNKWVDVEVNGLRLEFSSVFREDVESWFALERNDEAFSKVQVDIIYLCWKLSGVSTGFEAVFSPGYHVAPRSWREVEVGNILVNSVTKE